MCLLCGIKHFFHVNAYAMFSLEFRLSLMSQMKQPFSKIWKCIILLEADQFVQRLINEHITNFKLF